MNKRELNEILRLHRLWVYDDTKGKRANLFGANLFGANLREANLYEADLSEADLRRANLRGADLRGANLIRADLSEADLYEANLFGADLSEADLRGANLRGANLFGADLIRADLRGADLSGADLRRAKDILVFISQQHRAIQYLDRIQIGCEDHNIDYWRQHFAQIGAKHEYSFDEIVDYGNFIELCYNRYNRFQKRCIKEQIEAEKRGL